MLIHMRGRFFKTMIWAMGIIFDLAIYMATPPVSISLYGNGRLSGFGREFEYLKECGYIYDAVSSTMVKNDRRI